jgi:hypothetical protein
VRSLPHRRSWTEATSACDGRDGVSEPPRATIGFHVRCLATSHPTASAVRWVGAARARLRSALCGRHSTPLIGGCPDIAPDTVTTILKDNTFPARATAPAKLNAEPQVIPETLTDRTGKHHSDIPKARRREPPTTFPKYDPTTTSLRHRSCLASPTLLKSPREPARPARCRSPSR